MNAPHEFIASFEDIAKLRAAAIAEGCPEDGSYLDYVEAADHQTRKRFDTKEKAISWVKQNILDLKTAFGVGDITEGYAVTNGERCRYCVCNGWRAVSRTIVEDDGPLDEEALDNDCVD